MLLPYLQKGRIECGLDEAGRGCLAGPVFAAAVILPPDFDATKKYPVILDLATKCLTIPNNCQKQNAIS